MSTPLFTLKSRDGFGALVAATRQTDVIPKILLRCNIDLGNLLLIPDVGLSSIEAVEVELDNDGKINGDTGIQLLANEADELGLTNNVEWTISFPLPGIRVNGVTHALSSWSFTAGADGETIYIEDVARVVNTKASGWTRGAPGLDGTSFIWRGTWDSETEYITNDVVSLDGSSYICVNSTSIDSPIEDTDNWDLIAQAGEDPPRWAGEYDVSGETTYATKDLVLFRSDLYICTVDETIGNPIDYPERWDLFLEGSSFPEWDDQTDYLTNDFVHYNGNIWKAVEDSNDETPSLYSTYWELNSQGAFYPVLENIEGTIYFRGLVMGTTTSDGSSNPLYLNLGGTFGTNDPGHPNNLKLRLFDQDGNTGSFYGFGVSGSRLEGQVPAGAVHTRYVGGVPVWEASIDGVTAYDIDTESLEAVELSSHKNQPDGYAGLDSSGKIDSDQLPFDVMQFKGTWNATTNTPELIDGTGDLGDIYIVSTGGSIDLGSGTITFVANEQVVYDADDKWVRLSGASDVVRLTATQTITNKTLTSPKINAIIDGNSNTLVEFSETSGAVNYFQIANATSTNGPSFKAIGAGSNLDIIAIPKGVGALHVYGDTGQITIPIKVGGSASNVNMNLTTQGTGKVQLNGVEAVGISSTQTLTNKTIDLTSNTLTGTLAQFNTALSGADFVSLTGTETLTNKTLTNPKINAIYTTTGYAACQIGGDANSVNYLYFWSGQTGYASQIASLGADTNIHLDLYGKGTGYIRANGVEVVTISGTQTLTNKTLTNPKVGMFNDSNGNAIMSFTGTASAAAYFTVLNDVAGSGPELRAASSSSDSQIYLTPKGAGVLYIYGSSSQTSRTIQAHSSATNVDLNLATKGTGVVNINGVAAVTISGTQTLTNKTITSGKYDHIYDTNGNRIIRFSPTSSAVNYIWVANSATGLAPNITCGGSDTDISMWLASKGTGEFFFANDASAIQFKIGNVTSAVNYLRAKGGITTAAAVLEAIGSDTNIDVNIVGKGTGVVKAGGIEIVTLSGTQTLTNKTLTAPKISEIRDTNGNKQIEWNAVASAVNYIQISNRAAGVGDPHVKSVGSDTNINLNLATTGTGIVKVNSVEVATVSGTQTLTNKTISGSSNTLSNIAVGSIAATGTPDNTTYLRGDGTWSTVSGSGDASTNTATSVDSEVVVFSGTGGKTLKRATGTGIAYLTSGVLSAVTAVKVDSFSGTTNNTKVLEIVDVSSGVNYARITNATTSNRVILEATGSATDVGWNVYTKGAGRLNVHCNAGSNQALSLIPDSSSVNYITLTSKNTGSSPTITTANGSDTNIHLLLVTKGTGTVQANGVELVTISGTQTLTNKTLTNPTITGFIESVVAIGTVTTSSTISLANGTVQTATLTASTACTFTMPTAVAGQSFSLFLKQAASTGGGSATFTGVKWGSLGAPTITSTAGKMDILTFVSDGTNWYGSYTQGFTP